MPGLSSFSFLHGALAGGAALAFAWSVARNPGAGALAAGAASGGSAGGDGATAAAGSSGDTPATTLGTVRALPLWRASGGPLR